MANNIKSGPGIEILNSSYSPSVSHTGMVRWNGTTQLLEVMTNEPTIYNAQWVALSNGSELMVSIDPTYRIAFDWAVKKMTEEAKLKDLLAKHPGLKNLKEKYEVMLALVQENESNADK